MKLLVRLALLFLPLAAVLGFAPQPETDASRPAATFAAYDVFIDSHNSPLAAWQIEIKDANTKTQIVGIEGGEPGPYAQAPHYDPRAMQHDHALIGAFSTEAALPTGRTRVARIHILTQGTPNWNTTVMTAGGADGRKIDAAVSLQPVEGDGK